MENKQIRIKYDENGVMLFWYWWSDEIEAWTKEIIDRENDIMWGNVYPIYSAQVKDIEQIKRALKETSVIDSFNYGKE